MKIQLDIAFEDFKANRTLTCEISYFFIPTFVVYPYLCDGMHYIHSYFRDFLYNGPMAHMAS